MGNLKDGKGALRIWSKYEFGYINLQIEQACLKFNEAQGTISAFGINKECMHIELCAQVDLFCFYKSNISYLEKNAYLNGSKMVTKIPHFHVILHLRKANRLLTNLTIDSSDVTFKDIIQNHVIF